MLRATRQRAHLPWKHNAVCLRPVIRPAQQAQLHTTIPTRPSSTVQRNSLQNLRPNPITASQFFVRRAVSSSTTNATTVDSTTNEPLVELLDRTGSLQLELGETDIAWRRRVSREVVDLEGPFRVAVIGEANTGTSAVVNSLLANPLGQPIVPEKIVTDIQPKIFKIGYGDQLEEFADSASGDVINIKCPADWLQRNKTEIYSISSFQDFEEHSDRLNNVLYQSELVILVTDTSRILSGSWESWFLKEFVAKGKQNIIVAVNGAGAALEEAVDVASKRLRSILPQPTVQSTTQPPSEGSTAAPTSPAPLRIPSVFPISTRSSTGLSDLRSTVIARLDTPSDRNAHKASATKFTAIRALERLLQKQAETNALLLSAKTESLTLANAVVAAEKRLVHDFQLRDLAVVQYGVTSFSDAIRTYFEKVKFWKLFWRSDFVAEDLKASMKEHSLLQAEYQMTYAVGRLNEGAHNLHELVRTYLANLQSSAHPFSNAPITQSIQKEATTVLDILNKKRAASALEVDPYVLRNEVASFDETKQCDALQRKAEKLVRNQLALQLVVYPVGLLFTHLGTPWAVSIPSTLFVSGLGLLWMRVRWGSFEEQFWTKISEAHKKLKNKLLTVYETRFTGVVAEPLASTIKILDDAVEQKIKDGEARRVEIEALINSLRR